MTIRSSYKLIATAALLATTVAGFAQGIATMHDPNTTVTSQEPVNDTWKPSLVRDGAYDRTPHATNPLAWQPIREADVLWKKRVWREVDTRQKQNLAFRYPGDDETGGGYFIEILLDAIKKGKIKAYSTFDDRFTQALSKDQVTEMLTGKDDTIMVENPVTGQMEMRITHKDFNVDAVTKYRVKEDWIFDRNLGRMVVRIIGIAPMIDKYNDDGSFRASAPLFWLYYPEMRQTLAQYEVYNPDNDVQRLTWDDYLEGRFWTGRIIQVSNSTNSSFKEMRMSQMEALYEGQRSMDDITNKELDMWAN